MDGVKVKSTVTGDKRLYERLKKKNKVVTAAVKRGTLKAARALLADSREIVPVDTGRLYRSGRARHQKVTRDEMGFLRGTDGRFTSKSTFSADVTYNTPYAIYVHEDPNARHKPGKSYKYLEKPARRYKRRYAKIISDEVRAA